MTITAGGVAITTPQVLSINTSLGLDQVNNTSDINKPVSTAQAAALSLKANLAGQNNFTGVQTNTLFTPSYAATITPDGSTWNDHNNIGTLTGNLTLANPVGFTNAVSLRIWLTQDATGSRLITFGSQYKCAGGTIASNIVLSTAANAVDLLTITFNPVKSIWLTSIAKAIA